MCDRRCSRNAHKPSGHGSLANRSCRPPKIFRGPISGHPIRPWSSDRERDKASAPRTQSEKPTSSGHQARSGCNFRDLGIRVAIAARPSSAQNEDTETRSNPSSQTSWSEVSSSLAATHSSKLVGSLVSSAQSSERSTPWIRIDTSKISSERGPDQSSTSGRPCCAHMDMNGSIQIPWIAGAICRHSGQPRTTLLSIAEDGNASCLNQDVLRPINGVF
ncbi:hypothetical protein XINFAN_02243 [Pseudogemmobacter humi]|uniref:Uncharacterized protein n=1 Tax=Pseudogemmobacter humi TaxID=2483812 RepID=A0A3P5XMX1_9RHOB|nr:hypothetical protein XINFAN_02243 [Pseudogemmobacter humi]